MSMYACGASIGVSWDYTVPPQQMPLDNDWIGIYACDITEFNHANVWQWVCNGLPGDATCGPEPTGSTVLDSLPPYNSNGPHNWPLEPGCYKAVLLREDAPSAPPYIAICESAPFNVVC